MYRSSEEAVAVADGLIHPHAERSDTERLAYAKAPKWINYMVAEEIIGDLDEILDERYTPRMPRMPCRLIYGPTNGGKTWIARRFISKYAQANATGSPAITVNEKAGLGASISPVLYMQVPPQPSEARIYEEILKRLGVDVDTGARVTNKMDLAIDALHDAGVRMLFIDEIHNAIVGSRNQQRQFLYTLKYLANDVELSIVALGTDEALAAVNTAPEMASRFYPLPVPAWRDDDAYVALLRRMAKGIPLRKPVDLTTDERISRELLALSEGFIGDIVDVLYRATRRAIRTGSEEITVPLLRDLRYIPFSKRGRPHYARDRDA